MGNSQRQGHYRQELALEESCGYIGTMYSGVTSRSRRTLGGGPRVSSGVEEYKESAFCDGSTPSDPSLYTLASGCSVAEGLTRDCHGQRS